MPSLKVYSFAKIFFGMISCCTQGTAAIFRWPCETIIFSIDHFEGSVDAQLNS